MCPRPGLALVSYSLQLGIPRLSAQRKPSGIAVRSTVLTESGCTTCMLRELGGGLMQCQVKALGVVFCGYIMIHRTPTEFGSLVNVEPDVE